MAGLNSRVHPVLDEAVTVADDLGDAERLARAALGFSDPLVWAMYEELNATDVLVERIDRALRGAGSRWRSMLLSAAAIIGAFTRPDGREPRAGRAGDRGGLRRPRRCCGR